MLNLPKARVYGAPATPPPNRIAGLIRAVDRRLQDDSGWFSWRGVSDLAAPGYVLSGRAQMVWDRFDLYAQAGRTVVRCCGMLAEAPWVAANLAFSPRTPGYAEAREAIVAAAAARGMRVEWCLFADAQIAMPSASDRLACVLEFAAFCLAHQSVVPQLANEAVKNGWESAVDPALLALADAFAAAVGHKDFSISDPGDTDQEAPAAITAMFVTLSRHSNILVWHPDRSYNTADARWRRWIDHMEGETDITGELAPGVAFVVDEPMGAAPVEIAGRRDDDPDAFLAAQVVAACCGFGYTYHKIDSEIATAALPGFYGAAAALVARLPCSPDWRYLNDSWPGAPTEGITWRGKEGKVRNLVSGGQAWTVAYGEADFDSVKWRAGWTPKVEYAGARVRVWSVTR